MSDCVCRPKTSQRADGQTQQRLFYQHAHDVEPFKKVNRGLKYSAFEGVFGHFQRVN